MDAIIHYMSVSLVHCPRNFFNPRRQNDAGCQLVSDFGTECSSIGQLADIYRIKVNRWGRAPLSYRKKQIQAIPN